MVVRFNNLQTLSGDLRLIIDQGRVAASVKAALVGKRTRKKCMKSGI